MSIKIRMIYDICLAQIIDDDHRLVVYGNSCTEVNNEGFLNG